jgi:hypothetical protein
VISVTPNAGKTRTGSVAVGSTSIPIQQGASGCIYTVSTSSLNFPQTGGTTTANVTTGSHCDWNVTGLPLWLSVTSGASGTGNGTVTFQARANPFLGTRFGSLIIADNFVPASETGTGGAGAQQSTVPPARPDPRCMQPGPACPAGLPSYPRH